MFFDHFPTVFGQFSDFFGRIFEFPLDDFSSFLTIFRLFLDDFLSLFDHFPTIFGRFSDIFWTNFRIFFEQFLVCFDDFPTIFGRFPVFF